jgi:hypothetical protein
VGGIDFNKPRRRRVAEAVLALSISPTSPGGFTASELAPKVRSLNRPIHGDYGPRRAAYDLRSCGARVWFARSGPLDPLPETTRRPPMVENRNNATNTPKRTLFMTKFMMNGASYPANFFVTRSSSALGGR